MSEAKETNFADWQNTASSMVGLMFLNPTLPFMLHAQSTFLAAVEQAMAEWLRQRREALAEAERMVARMQTCPSLTEVWALQREWMDHASQRFAADAARCQSAVMTLAQPGSNERKVDAAHAPSEIKPVAATRSPPAPARAAVTTQ